MKDTKKKDEPSCIPDLRKMLGRRDKGTNNAKKGRMHSFYCFVSLPDNSGFGRGSLETLQKTTRRAREYDTGSHEEAWGNKA